MEKRQLVDCRLDSGIVAAQRRKLLFMTQKIKESLLRDKRVFSFSFDISKAFDSVWHTGIIHEIIKIKIPNYLINIVRDFLSNRSFYVQVGSDKSFLLKISNGVPQGSKCLSVRRINCNHYTLFLSSYHPFFVIKPPFYFFR